MKQLAPYVSAFISSGLGVFGKGSKQVIIQDMDYWNVLTQVAEAWKQPAESNKKTRLYSLVFSTVIDYDL